MYGGVNYAFFSTITHKIFETNSNFFKGFLLVSTKPSFWQEDWELGYHAMKFRQFLIFPIFLRS